MTTAAKAREAAGLTVEQAAKRARVGQAYLRRVERNGGAPYVLATRLAHIYGCSLNLFLQRRVVRTPGPASGGRPSLHWHLHRSVVGKVRRGSKGV